VQQSFRYGEQEAVPGQLLDASEWPDENLRAMKNQRFIRVATKDEIASAVEEDDEPPRPVRKKTAVKIRRR